MTQKVDYRLSEAGEVEMSRLSGLTGLSVCELLQHGISLLRIYVKAHSEGKEVRIVDPKDYGRYTRIEMPVEVERA